MSSIYIDVIKDVYDGVVTRMRTMGGATMPFPITMRTMGGAIVPFSITIDLYHVSLLSPFLFALVMNEFYEAYIEKSIMVHVVC